MNLRYITAFVAMILNNKACIEAPPSPNNVSPLSLVCLSGPCPPEGVQVALACETNVATVSWFSAVMADRYEATLTVGDGHTHNCSSDSPSCEVDDIHTLSPW